MRLETQPVLTIWLLALALALMASHWGVLDAAEIVTVRLYVDEEEVTSPPAWRNRLSLRLNAASRIISQHADVKFVVADYGRWESDDRVQDLSKSLREFEQEVDSGQVRIAIGFSSQYKFRSGRNNLGGTRGPMRRHILIRENAESILEPERLEVLVHELGHFLGAAHSASPTSVMRPVVGDGQARAAAFRITFDPFNSKIIRLVGRELRDRNVTRFQDMSPTTLAQLRRPYHELAKRLPEDKTALRYLYAINSVLKAPPERVDPSKIKIPVSPLR